MSYTGNVASFPTIIHNKSPTVLSSSGWLWHPSSNTQGIDLLLAALSCSGPNGAFVQLFIEVTVNQTPQLHSNRRLTEIGAGSGAISQAVTIQGLHFPAGIGIYCEMSNGKIIARLR